MNRPESGENIGSGERRSNAVTMTKSKSAGLATGPRKT
jgi:hypothetical protein